jgi:hypothetical protein
VTKRYIQTLVLLAIATGTAVVAAPKFTSTWTSPDAAGVSFAGKKVAALVISGDDSLRVSGEEGLARELTARGMQGVATYRIAPKEELRAADTAKPWFERTGVEGVVAMRPVSAEKEREYTPATWVNPYYGSLWGYYGYGWGSLYIPGSVREDTVVIVETLIYSVPKDKLLWAGVSKTKNPKKLATFIEDLVNAAAKEMGKQGLTRKAAS